MVLEWETYLKVLGWKSEYRSVNNLLRFLKNRRIGSEGSRGTFCFALRNFCKQTGKTPEELVILSKGEVESLIEDFALEKKESGCCPRSINTLLSNLQSFFKANGFRNERELNIEFFHQPARSRSRPEYIPTLEEASRMAECSKTLRDKTVILLFTFSGLRNSTLRGLRFGDVREELQRGEENILIRIYPDMKRLVNAACKGSIGYFTFACKKVTDTLRLYVAELRDNMGEIPDDSPLFPSGYNQLPRADRFKRPVSARQLQTIIKEAAKRAGLRDWKIVHCHCLRKTFETLLRSRLKDGTRLDFQDQVFLMGHILPGGLDPYYDKGKIEDMRRKYSKLVFTETDERLSKAIDALRVSKEFVRACGNSPASFGTKETEAVDPYEISKALGEIIDELQYNTVHEQSRVESSKANEQTNQDKTANNHGSADQSPVHRRLQGTKRISASRGLAMAKQDKVRVKINHAGKINRETAKQVELDVFLGSQIPWKDTVRARGMEQ
jgi:integrase